MVLAWQLPLRSLNRRVLAQSGIPRNPGQALFGRTCGDGQRTDRQDSEKVQHSQGIPPVCVSLTVSSPRIGAFVVEALSPSVYDYI